MDKVKRIEHIFIKNILRIFLMICLESKIFCKRAENVV